MKKVENCNEEVLSTPDRQEYSKFNISKDIEKRSYNGVTFDSVLEMKYYRDIVLPKVESGEIVKYELQKKYILQEGFEHNGKRVLPITYISDFYLEYANGSNEIIDVKGLPDNVAKIKRKMFWKIYPDANYIWMVYAKKFGGWVTYEEAQAKRLEEKKLKNLKEKT